MTQPSPRLAGSCVIAVAVLAYVNAWPDVAIMDDAAFAAHDRFAYLGLNDLLRFFTEDLWAASGIESGLYRPILLLSFALDSSLFGEWLAGYHLVSIFLHVVATWFIYQFCRYLLHADGCDAADAVAPAMLAAVLFAVHPVGVEVVNSLYNRSESLVVIGMVCGLLWFLPRRESRPVAAWLGLGAAYLLVLMCKEHAVVLPALVVLLIWVVSDEPVTERLRSCLQVLWLLIPLSLYLVLRFQALDTGLPGPTVEAAAAEPLIADGSRTWLDRLQFLPAVWLESLRLVVWPNPLQIFHPIPSTNPWLALLIQVGLLSLAILLYWKKRKGLLIGLLFFYVAILPSSRLIGDSSVLPHVAERYLYLPMVGIAMLVAYEARRALVRPGPRWVFPAAALVALIFMTLTLDRNSDWAGAVRLAETDYEKDADSGRIVETLLEALLAEGNTSRAIEICDQHSVDLPESPFRSNSCGVAYFRAGRTADAETVLLVAVTGKNQASARFNLGSLYLQAGRRNEATEQFRLGIEAEDVPFLRAYREAEALIQLYPRNRTRLLEARTWLRQTLDLQPQFFQARSRLNRLEQQLGLTPGSEKGGS